MTERDHLDPATIAALVDRTLDAAARAAAEAHLAACADCREVWVETSEMAEAVGGGISTDAANAPSDVVALRRRSRRWIYSGAGLAAAAVVVIAVGTGWWETRKREEMNRLLEDAIEATNRQRFTEARLSRSNAWGPVPSPQRNAARSSQVLEETIAILTREAESRSTAEAFHRLGLAYLAAGRPDDAVVRLRQAATLNRTAAHIQLDLSAALLEACRDGCSHEAQEDALRAAQAAHEMLRSAPAAFNRSLAFEQLGRRREALDSWREFLGMETSPSWRAEATSHLNQVTPK